jgi:drug/metabolite transporter (DMT)-like permease
VGIASSALLLGEKVDAQLIIAAGIILLGMLVATVNLPKPNRA